MMKKRRLWCAWSDKVLETHPRIVSTDKEDSASEVLGIRPSSTDAGLEGLKGHKFGTSHEAGEGAARSLV